MKEKTFTPKRVAQAIGVSESSLKRWCDRGLLEVQRTAGGHRRIPISSIVRFIRESEYQLVSPGLLELSIPRNLESVEATTLEDSTRLLIDALLDGDEDKTRAILIRIFLNGQPLHAIFDSVIRPVFHEIGNLWEQGQIEIYQESRASQMITRALHEFRLFLKPPNRNELAICASVEGDTYTIPAQMVEIVLRDQGWRTQMLGSNLPLSAIFAASQETRPHLVALSISAIGNLDLLEKQFHQFRSQLDPSIPLVVGGRALNPSVRSRLRYTVHCDTMTNLVEFSGSLFPPHSNS